MVAPNLTNSTVLAGVTVSVGADLGKLRAGAAEAKQVAGHIEKTAKAVVPVRVDARQATKDLRAVRGEVQALQKELAALDRTLAGAAAGPAVAGPSTRNRQAWTSRSRTPRAARVRAAMAEKISAMKRDAEEASIEAEVNRRLFGDSRPSRDIGIRQKMVADRPFWVQADRDARAAEKRRWRRDRVFDTGSSHDGGIVGRDFLRPRPDSGGRAGSPGGGGSVGGGLLAGTDQIKAFGQSAQQLAKVGMLITAATATMESGLAAGRAVFERDPEKREKLIGQGQDAIRAIPVVGGAISGTGSTIHRWGSRVKNLIKGNGFNSDHELAEQTLEEAKDVDKKTAKLQKRAERQQAGNAQARPIVRAAALDLASVGKTGGERAVLAARDELAQYRETIDKQGLKATADQHDALRGLQSRVTVAQQEAAKEQMIAGLGESGRYQASSLRMEAVKARMAGRGVEATEKELAAERDSRASANAQELLAAPDSQKEQVKARQGREMEEFDLRAREQIEEQKRALAADTADAQAAVAEAALRIQKRTYEADLQAFDRATAAKLSTLKGAERENEENRRGAERGALVAAQQEEQQRIVRGAQADEKVATLLADKKFEEADRAAFDAAAEERRRAVKGKGPEAEEATERAIAAEKKLMERRQAEQQASFDRRMAGRRDMAEAGRNRWDRAGAAIGTIVGYDDELAAAGAGQQAALAKTQTAELQTLREQLAGVNNRTYAREFRVGGDVAGATQGDAVKETNEILRRIEQALKQREGVQ